MSNKQLIKSAHVWALAAILAGGCWAITAKAGIGGQEQNSNQNSNRSANRNMRGNSNATGERAGMGSMTSQDHDFIMDAAMGGMMEVELGRVAAEKGMSDAVKQFGQRMVDDHSKANQELMSLARGKGITLPTTIDEKHQKEMTKFSSLSGAEFDREYTKMMVSDHRKDVSEFEKQSTRGTDAALKAFATKTLSTLREHLHMAEALPDAKTSGGAMNSNSNRNRNGNSNNSNQP